MLQDRRPPVLAPGVAEAMYHALVIAPEAVADRVARALPPGSLDGFAVRIAPSMAAAFGLPGQFDPDCVLIDCLQAGAATLEALQTRLPEVPVLVLAGPGDESAALLATRTGTADYVATATLGQFSLAARLRQTIAAHRAERRGGSPQRVLLLTDCSETVDSVGQSLGPASLVTGSLYGQGAASLPPAAGWDCIILAPGSSPICPALLPLMLESDPLLAVVVLGAESAETTQHLLQAGVREVTAPDDPALGPRLRAILSRVVAERAQARANLRIARQRDELARSNRELENFAYVASHDLRAPLRAFLTLPDWIREDMAEAGQDPGAIAEHLEMIEVQARRMNMLLGDLLEYSRIGRAQGQAEPVALTPLAHTIVALLSPPAAARIMVAPDLPVVSVVRAEAEMVLRNLIGNALKHAERADPCVQIEGWRDAGGTVLRVIDNGPGIAPEYRDRVFQLFTTLRSRDEVEGSGLGLAMVRKIVDIWGGSIGIGDAPEGRGAVFEIRLKPPRAR